MTEKYYIYNIEFIGFNIQQLLWSQYEKHTTNVLSSENIIDI